MFDLVGIGCEFELVDDGDLGGGSCAIEGPAEFDSCEPEFAAQRVGRAAEPLGFNGIDERLEVICERERDKASRAARKAW